MARAEEAAHLIAYRAPILERLYLHDEDEYSIEVVEAFKYQTGNMFKYRSNVLFYRGGGQEVL